MFLCKKNVFFHLNIFVTIIMCDISDDVFKDTQIDVWLERQLILDGSKQIMRKIVHNPSNNINVLKKRQHLIRRFNLDVRYQLIYIKETERDVIKTLEYVKGTSGTSEEIRKETEKDKSDGEGKGVGDGIGVGEGKVDGDGEGKEGEEGAEDIMMSHLFPDDFYNSWISKITHFLDMYHGYRIYTLPLLQIISPVGIILTPYIYLTKNMGMNMTLYEYLSFIWRLLVIYIEYGGNIKYMLIKWITMMVYVSVYIYNIWQSCDNAITLHGYRQTILNRMNNVAAFLEMSQNLFVMLGDDYLEQVTSHFNIPSPDTSFMIDGSLANAYCFWTNTDNYRYRLQSILDTIHIIDILNCTSNLLSNPHWCMVYYNGSCSGNVEMIDARSPWLDANQQENNIDLCKNVVVTGPNAGGKTTYVKTLVTNILLGQTFGIAMCSHISMCIFDVISTFMRVTDVLGSLSYFEAETAYCKAMIDKAETAKKKMEKMEEMEKTVTANTPNATKMDKTMNILFVMDEPMHSTPPTEGQSTAYAVCEYLAINYPFCRLIITTHFHNMVKLEEEYPELFKNVSMDAIENPDGSFHFPYKIRDTYSFQCIAIELLGNKMFPPKLIQSAIKQKNKCEKLI